MKFKFVWVGKTRDPNWQTLQAEYLRRLSHFVNCEIVVVKDAGGPTAIEMEGNDLLSKLNQNTVVVLLDVTGPHLSSPELAAELDKWQIRGYREGAFIIGGVEGVSP